MGRKSTIQSGEMYSLVQSTIEGMHIGDVRIIDKPKHIEFFRKYLSEISKRYESRYTTKTLPDDKLQIMRVKYYNIHSHKVEE